MEIVDARLENMNCVVQLFREYQKYLGIDLTFQSFEEELAGLPGSYSHPEGGIFLAKEGETYVGCVAIRAHSSTEAELKRLYVQPASRGRGTGWLLFQRAMQKASVAGYTSVVLDTLPSMAGAKTMYLKYGFQPIKPYYNNPIQGAEFYRYVYS